MIIEKASAAAMYGGAGSSLMFGLSASEWSVVGVISGIVIAVIGLIINTWYKEQHRQIALRQAKADPDA
jgi:hypothetical protein